MSDTYDRFLTWKENLTTAPELPTECVENIPFPGTWTWCGLPVNSPLGISAGPLLNSRWLLHYAQIGFDILVYKTVRSQARDCYPLPNLVPVEIHQLSEPGHTLAPQAEMSGSWAVSFGMPSQHPDTWRADITIARDRLAKGQLLIVSVVGTQDETIDDPQRSLDHLADDFALCAKWAVDAGAHGIEANFSCPNVSTADGQIYQQPAVARQVAMRIRESIGGVPLVLKIGHISTSALAQQLLDAVQPHVDGLAMTNSIAARITDPADRLMFNGQMRGICGAATREASLQQVRMFAELKESTKPLDLIGVGGIFEAEHVRQYLDAGAESVAMATSAMMEPETAIRIRRQWETART